MSECAIICCERLVQLAHSPRLRECLYAVWESNPDEYYKVDEDGEGAEGQQPESADGMDTKA